LVPAFLLGPLICEVDRRCMTRRAADRRPASWPSWRATTLLRWVAQTALFTK